MSRTERESEPRPNPMNNLVPYLDLFCRLDDAELARLGGVEADVVVSLRAQVDAINEGLSAYADLLPRLADAELVRLTGASDRTIRFWRLCQPRHAAAAKPAAPAAAKPTEARGPAAGAAGVPGPSGRTPTAPHSVVVEAPAENTGRAPSAADMTATGPASGEGDGAGYVTLSGAPFPGFDDAAGDDDGVGLEGVSLDGEPDPLGLGDP
ncbi:MAG: hypothetical protein ACRBN8_15810 [Nannocystales bacterium]